MLAVLAAATSRPPGTVDVLSTCAPLPQSPASGRPPVYILVGVVAAMQPLARTSTVRATGCGSAELLACAHDAIARWCPGLLKLCSIAVTFTSAPILSGLTCSCSSTYPPSGLEQHQVSSRPDGDHEGEGSGSADMADEAEPKKGGRVAKQTARRAMAADTGRASADTEGTAASALEHDIGPAVLVGADVSSSAVGGEDVTRSWGTRHKLEKDKPPQQRGGERRQEDMPPRRWGGEGWRKALSKDTTMAVHDAQREISPPPTQVRSPCKMKIAAFPSRFFSRQLF